MKRDKVERMMKKATEKIKSTVAVALEGFNEIDAGVYELFFRTSTPTRDKEKIISALEEVLEDKLYPVSASLRVIDTKRDLFSVFAKVHPDKIETVEFTDDLSGRFKLVKANLFVDEVDNSLWELEEIGGKRVLVKSKQDDLYSFLNSKSKRRYLQASHLNGALPEAKDIVIAFDLDSDRYFAGIVEEVKEDNTIVVSSVDFVAKEIHPRQVIMINKNEGADEVLASYGMSLREYFEKIYKDTEFGRKLQELLENLNI